MSDKHFDVVVIGAGFGGIATAAALRRYGVAVLPCLRAAMATAISGRLTTTAFHCIPRGTDFLTMAATTNAIRCSNRAMNCSTISTVTPRVINLPN